MCRENVLSWTNGTMCQQLKMKTKKKCYRRSELPMPEGTVMYNIITPRFIQFFVYVFIFHLFPSILNKLHNNIYIYIFFITQWNSGYPSEIFEYVSLETFVLKRILIVTMLVDKSRSRLNRVRHHHRQRHYATPVCTCAGVLPIFFFNFFYGVVFEKNTLSNIINIFKKKNLTHLI